MVVISCISMPCSGSVFSEKVPPKIPTIAGSSPTKHPGQAPVIIPPKMPIAVTPETVLIACNSFTRWYISATAIATSIATIMFSIAKGIMNE